MQARLQLLWDSCSEAAPRGQASLGKRKAKGLVGHQSCMVWGVNGPTLCHITGVTMLLRSMYMYAHPLDGIKLHSCSASWSGRATVPTNQQGVLSRTVDGMD
jgi:hypothetical protein